MTRKEILGNVRKIIVKVGSAVLTGETVSTPNHRTARGRNLRQQGYQVVLVSPAPSPSGKHRLGITGKLQEHPQKQAAAAVGQSRLMRVYSNAFGNTVSSSGESSSR